MSCMSLVWLCFVVAPAVVFCWHCGLLHLVQTLGSNPALSRLWVAGREGKEESRKETCHDCYPQLCRVCSWILLSLHCCLTVVGTAITCKNSISSVLTRHQELRSATNGLMGIPEAVILVDIKSYFMKRELVCLNVSSLHTKPFFHGLNAFSFRTGMTSPPRQRQKWKNWKKIILSCLWLSGTTWWALPQTLLLTGLSTEA